MKHCIYFAVSAVSAALLASCCGSSNQQPVSEPEVIEPVQQAPPADPGQNNFGGSATARPQGPVDTTGMAARLRAMREAQNQIRTVHFNDLSMSDPYIFADETTQTYYLTSSGGRQYRSKDLVNWEGQYNIVDLSGTWCEKAGFAAAAKEPENTELKAAAWAKYKANVHAVFDKEEAFFALDPEKVATLQGLVDKFEFGE